MYNSNEKNLFLSIANKCAHKFLQPYSQALVNSNIFPPLFHVLGTVKAFFPSFVYLSYHGRQRGRMKNGTTNFILALLAMLFTIDSSRLKAHPKGQVPSLTSA